MLRYSWGASSGGGIADFPILPDFGYGMISIAAFRTCFWSLNLEIWLKPNDKRTPPIIEVLWLIFDASHFHSQPADE